jgi:hypothetical protein
MDEIRAAADEFLRETTGDRPDGNVPPLTDRARVSRVVRRYCQVYGVPFKDAWRRLKMEFRDRYHIDLAARARNYNEALQRRRQETGRVHGTGCQKKDLDIAQDLGRMADLLLVAYEIFVAHTNLTRTDALPLDSLWEQEES